MRCYNTCETGEATLGRLDVECWKRDDPLEWRRSDCCSTHPVFLLLLLQEASSHGHIIFKPTGLLIAHDGALFWIKPCILSKRTQFAAAEIARPYKWIYLSLFKHHQLEFDVERYLFFHCASSEILTDECMWLGYADIQVKLNVNLQSEQSESEDGRAGRDRWIGVRKKSPFKQNHGLCLEKTAACGEACFQIPVCGFISGADGGVHEEMVSPASFFGGWRGDITCNHNVVISAPWKLCVSVCVGMLCWFRVAIIHTHTHTCIHTQSSWCAGTFVCWEGLSCLVKLQFFFSSFSCVRFVWFESWVKRLTGREVSLQDDGFEKKKKKVPKQKNTHSSGHVFGFGFSLLTSLEVQNQWTIYDCAERSNQGLTVGYQTVFT